VASCDEGEAFEKKQSTLAKNFRSAAVMCKVIGKVSAALSFDPRNKDPYRSVQSETQCFRNATRKEVVTFVRRLGDVARLAWMLLLKKSDRHLGRGP
jgi:hypothetical protein